MEKLRLQNLQTYGCSRGNEKNKEEEGENLRVAMSLVGEERALSSNQTS